MHQSRYQFGAIRFSPLAGIHVPLTWNFRSTVRSSWRRFSPLAGIHVPLTYRGAVDLPRYRKEFQSPGGDSRSSDCDDPELRRGLASVRFSPLAGIHVPLTPWHLCHGRPTRPRFQSPGGDSRSSDFHGHRGELTAAIKFQSPGGDSRSSDVPRNCLASPTSRRFSPLAGIHVPLTCGTHCDGRSAMDLFQSPGGDSRSSDLQSRHITAEYTTIPLHVAL